MSMTRRGEYRIHQLFEVSILLKGANALVELILGALFLFVDVRDLALTLIQNALVEDPDGFLASHLLPYAQRISPNAELYSALYLISHGAVKMVLVWGLLRDKLWAYPASLAVLALFILYQLIRIVQTGSIPMVLLTLFDLVVIVLIWHEYRVLEAHKHP